MSRHRDMGYLQYHMLLAEKERGREMDKQLEALAATVEDFSS